MLKKINPAVAALTLLALSLAWMAMGQTHTGGFSFTRAILLGTFGRPITSTNDALDVNIKAPAQDGCAGPKIDAPISQTANAKVIPGHPGQRILICYAMIVGADAENISIVEGTDPACSAGTVAVMGGTTGATGPNFPAGSGYTGGGSLGTIHNTSVPGNDACVFQSGSGRVAGNFEYVYTAN